MAVRNPLVGLLTTLVWAAVLTALLSLPLLLFTYLALPSEVALIYGVAVFAVAGAVAGRSGTFAWAAFPTAFIGAFVGYAAFNLLFYAPMNLLYATIHATIAALGAWASSVSHMSKVRTEVRLESEDKRRCRMCGVRVGPRANRCWSCRASLNRIT